MKVAYLDTSVLVALAFREPGFRLWEARLAGYDALHSSELLAAEFLAVARREALPMEAARDALARVSWVVPQRSIRGEIDRVLSAGHVRGADLWHVACACYLAPSPHDVTFLSLDYRQRQVASALGFPVQSG